MKSFLCSILLLGATVTATAPKLSHNLPRLTHVHEKRVDTSSFTLYAYGGSTEENAVGGLPIIYADDGNAYLGKSAPPGASSYTNVTFSLTDTQLVASNVNSTSLYIQPTDGELNGTGFTSSPNSTQKTTGFTFFGASIFWVNDNSYESYFYAVETENSGVYSLNWGEGGSDDSSAIPVALRDIAPSSGKRTQKLTRDMFKQVV